MIRGVSLSEDITAVIVDALREHADSRAIMSPSPLGADTPLFGRDGVLDSLGLVALVVAVEQAIEDEYGVSLTLADERALSERKSPFATVGALAAYAARLIEGAR
jgi:D-alanine--poly(phosphoribitol) ligase subunit 2